ncbi:CCR4-NOT transcription complex, subunit 7 [Giardia muris]|uniref:poly(A)-specific ribonuclease n=1 Tax=Giardia muris TaxID=5742 RepID=A0A4Z1T1V4_GIAMU|nr:CCR4-NOT transcription complex, subunit 7 [Giardia muris]|eukprot:TNJ27913.1 CCR4-NOT transcription complex, subunit 7 [Giardia muris]
MTDTPSESAIKDVYAGDVSAAFREIRRLLPKYPVVAIDTEFPGSFNDTDRLALLAARPLLSSYSSAYARFRLNVDSMKLIQFGITLANHQGEFPTPHASWQFNLLFDTEKDISIQGSIALLKEHGLDFERNRREGIHPVVFSYEYLASGLLYNSDLTYVCFHGSYDFGYLISTVLCTDLPTTPLEFNSLLARMFPGPLCDIKVCYSWSSSLANLATECLVERLGTQHQAGSDALVTMKVYQCLRAARGAPRKELLHVLYGLEG